MRSGYTLARHLLSIVAVPIVIAIVVPVWLAARYSVAPAGPSDVGDGMLLAAGLMLLLLGIALFVSSLYQAVTRSPGALAPWDPPPRLVIRGPYRFVRNPMISGTMLVLFGEALALRSVPHAVWAAAFALLTLVYISLLVEPQLEARFGDEYREYERRVPRLLPRPRPWTPKGA